MPRRSYALLISIAVLTLRAAAQSPVPPLPRLELESYPPSTRDAISPALRAAAARSMDPAAVGGLARILHAWEQYDAAHQAYGRAQALAPGALEWHYLDAVVLTRLARHGAAAAQFEKAVAASPAYLPARVALAEALFDAGELDRSRRAFEALAGEPLAEPRVQFGLGRIEAAQNGPAAAIPRFERAIALFPEWGAAQYALAQAYRAAGRLDDARLALQRHAQYGARWPGIDDPVLSIVNALRDDARTNLQRGLKLAETGDLQGAIAAHEAAVARDPELAQAHANLISLYGRARDWTKAEEHYRATVALGFSLAEAHYDYGVLLGLQEKWDAAEEAYRRALAVNPLHFEAHNNLGQLLERRREFEAAAAEYARAVDARPTFRLARFNLGRMLMGLGRPQEAIAAFEKLQAPRDAETPRYLFALASAHLRAGHRDEAVRWATEARQLALESGQRDLADTIDRELAALK
jgi:tetratricopeptide (TPR) repeat protein